MVESDFISYLLVTGCRHQVKAKVKLHMICDDMVVTVKTSAMRNTILLLLPTISWCLNLERSVIEVKIDDYHSHDQLEEIVNNLANDYDFIEQYELGRSVQVQ